MPGDRSPRTRLYAWACSFGVDARFWVNLQAEYDMRIGSRALQLGTAYQIRPFGYDFKPGGEP
jgi:hypothetical protein